MNVGYLAIDFSLLIGLLLIAAAIYFGLTVPIKDKKPKNRR